MFDIEAAIEARYEKTRPEYRRLAHDEGDAWVYANEAQLHRRWLALYRGDRWSLERIAELDGTTIAQVWCGIVLAMRHEPRNGRRGTEPSIARRAG
ncbi:MAG TPA: hypothetical protein VFZ65_13165 [Planctomycetota bacterium]|nr:hypothetical protein [Planctomycetota bacterium]